MKNNPDLVLDPSTQELSEQYHNFIERRYDQSIFTLTAYCHKSEFNIKIFPEYFEVNSRGLDRPAILAKCRNIGEYDFIKYLKFLINKILLKFKGY